MDTAPLPTPVRSQSCLRVVGCLVTLVVALGAPLGALYIVIRPALPRELVKQIEPGMSTDQVHEILGEPQGYEGDFQWEYWRWGNAGWIEIYFDEDGFVDYVNDESIFP